MTDIKPKRILVVLSCITTFLSFKENAFFFPALPLCAPPC